MLARLLLAVVLAISVSAHAAATVAIPINGLFNTGVSAPNTPLANDGSDPHWTVNNTVAYANARNGIFPVTTGIWMANTTASRWIGPSMFPASGQLNNVPGNYIYQLNFTITPLQLANTASFTARIASDNATTSILLNGNTIPVPTGVGFASWTNFSVTSGFVAGLNTLSLKVNNAAGTSGNPTGFRLEFVTSTIEVLPEPGTWALLIVGFGLVGATSRRQRRHRNDAAA